jgi:hypothetical protein
MHPYLLLSTLLPLHWDVPCDRLGGWIHCFALGHALPSVKTGWRILFLHLAQHVKPSARKSTKPHFYPKMRTGLENACQKDLREKRLHCALCERAERCRLCKGEALCTNQDQDGHREGGFNVLAHRNRVVYKEEIGILQDLPDKVSKT